MIGGCRTEFVVGKGGSGKSTVAAATAIARSDAGEQVLLVSIAQSHSLAEILDLEPGSRGEVRRVRFGLDLLEVDTLALLQDRYQNLVKLAGVGQAFGQSLLANPLDPRELAGLPGVESILALAEIAEHVADDDWDVVIVDCPSSAEALSVLTMPEMILGYLERLWPHEQRSSEALSSGLRTALMVSGVERMSNAVSAVRTLLDDRDRTTVTLVTTPDRLSVHELIRTRSAFALAGMRVRDVVVNRVAPAAPGQSRWISEVADRIQDIPIIHLLEQHDEPIGLAALSGFAVPEFADADVIEPVVVVPNSDGATMRVFLPVADPSSVSLARVATDLIVGADGARRRIGLDTRLRECSVVGAEFDGEFLVVSFAAKSAK